MPLEPGDEMTAAEFRRRNAVTSEDLRAELVEGFVYMSAAVRTAHGGPHSLMIGCLEIYCGETPGLDCLADATDRLDDENEPRPDVAAFIEPGYGGRCRIDRQGYLTGGPQFICEIAASTEFLDRGMKRRVYQRHGVEEYLVWRTRREFIETYRLIDGDLVLVDADADGIYRSRIFPGLWLDLAAAVGKDRRRLHRTLREGIETDEHAAFVSRLAEAKHRHESSDAG